MNIKRIRKAFYTERENKNFKVKNKEAFTKYQILEAYQEAFDKVEDILLNGDILLGAVVMANNLLFETNNKYNCPGVFVYSRDTYYEHNQDELINIAHNMYSLRELDYEELDEDEKYISDLLNDEVTPIPNILIPSSLTDGKEVFMVSILMMRRELKDRYLQGILHPLLIKEDIKYGRLLPIKFYDEEYVIQNEYGFRNAIQFFISIIFVIVSVATYLLNLKTVWIISVTLFVIFVLFNYRCPKCNKFLIGNIEDNKCKKCSSILMK